ncbi:helix-turn-helix transcriptional regulator [Natronoglycomyces albus]|uniref:Transcriptional regulator n=1 Tax=Natronoglycomyces albus TaxID=2811108 RepID=A0A895XJ64_9ACTN|nr:metalloregulator ArsR/SmtB family transcription factor [Natronoglycomyces albus]QSB03862.1 transcriptional regulator [Natronoglycomyces albus]
MEKATRAHSGCSTPDGDTRRRVSELLLEHGHATARDLALILGITPVAVRRHLDAMESEGLVSIRDVGSTHRGRGRPARHYQLTAAARESFGHTYDDLAVQAMRWIHRHGGDHAVESFADQQVSRLEERCKTALADIDENDPLSRAEALAEALSSEGYAATSSTLAGGGQLCQHHCPVAGVASEFPQLCEAETKVISKLLGVHVQRLATIANGDGVCTTHIPGPLSSRGDRPTT